MRTVEPLCSAPFENDPREGKAPMQIHVERVAPEARLPEYENDQDAGAVVYALSGAILAPHETRLMRTGLRIVIPDGYEGQIRSRGELARNHGISVADAPATIDAGCRGEISVLLSNLGRQYVTLRPGDPIARLVIVPVIRASFVETAISGDTPGRVIDLNDQRPPEVEIARAAASHPHRR